MTPKEKLIELLDAAFLDSDDNYGVPDREQVADYLLVNGVIVPMRQCTAKIYAVPALLANKKEKNDDTKRKFNLSNP